MSMGTRMVSYMGGAPDWLTGMDFLQFVPIVALLNHSIACSHVRLAPGFDATSNVRVYAPVQARHGFDGRRPAAQSPVSRRILETLRAACFQRPLARSAPFFCLADRLPDGRLAFINWIGFASWQGPAQQFREGGSGLFRIPDRRAAIRSRDPRLPRLHGHPALHGDARADARLSQPDHPRHRHRHDRVFPQLLRPAPDHHHHVDRLPLFRDGEPGAGPAAALEEGGAGRARQDPQRECGRHSSPPMAESGPCIS